MVVVGILQLVITLFFGVLFYKLIRAILIILTDTNFVMLFSIS